MSDPPNVLAGIQKSQRDRILAAAGAFLGELREIQAHDRGRMAALKRNAGEMLFGRGTSWFYSLLTTPEQRKYREVFYLIATLFDFNRLPGRRGSFGATLRSLAQAMNREPSKFRRFHILLDAEFDRVHDPDLVESPWAEGGGELAFRLRQMVQLLAAKNIGVDWAELITDLCDWSRPDRRVQKKWARDFFGGGSLDTANTETNAERPSQTTDDESVTDGLD